MQQEKTLIICDYSWMTHRFYHVFQNMQYTNDDGETYNTGVMFGFCKFINSIFSRYNNFDLMFAKDVSSEERKAMDPNYKSNRVHDPETFRMDEDCVTLMCYPKNVYFLNAPAKEADDVMALYAIQNLKNYEKVIIYSGDNDMLQLKALGIEVARELDKKGLMYVGQDYIEKKFGPLDIKHLLFFRALKGDGSDNIAAPCKGLRLTFLYEFIKVWHDLGLDYALSEETEQVMIDLKLPKVNIKEQFKRLRENKDTIINNYNLMSLLKYTKEENAFEINKFFNPVDYTLLERYGLGHYEHFVDYLKQINFVREIPNEA